MPKRSKNILVGSVEIGRRLRAAILDRAQALGLTLTQVSAAVGRDESTLRAWFRGSNRMTFEDVLQLEAYFTEQGFPGLIDELRPSRTQSQWRLQEQPLEALRSPSELELLRAAYQLLDTAEPLAPLSMLAANGLLDRAQLHLLLSDAAYPVHCGLQTPSSPMASLLPGRDPQDQPDPSFALALQRHLLGLEGQRQPRLHSLSSAGTRQRCLSVPLSPRFVVTFPLEQDPV